MIDRRVMRAELRCLQCGRQAATATQMPRGLVLTPLPGFTPEDVRRYRCSACGGRLWMEYAREEVAHRRLRPDEIGPYLPRRGRPRKQVSS